MEFDELCDAILNELPPDMAKQLKPRINSINYTASYRAPELMRESWLELSSTLEVIDRNADYAKTIIALWATAAKTAIDRHGSMKKVT